MTGYGFQGMVNDLGRVLMRRPGRSPIQADQEKWRYGPTFDGETAVRQYGEFAKFIETSGAEILWFEDSGDGLADAMSTHDPSLMTGHGAIILRMGKTFRNGETALHEAAYDKASIPVIGRIEAPGTVEGGDCIWLDPTTLVVGRGVRSNANGISQLAGMLGTYGIRVLSYYLPYGRARKPACI